MTQTFLGRAILRALPGAMLGAAGGALGLRDPVSIALAIAGALWLTVEAMLVAPRARRRADAGSPATSAAETFLQRALELPSASAVASELSRAAAAAVGDPRIFLLVPSQDRGLRVLGKDGQPADIDLGDPAPAFAWLETFAEPMSRTQIAGSPGDGPRAAGQLLQNAGCEIVLPLRHRGLLLALALIGAGDVEADATFLRALRAYATVAVANTFLGQEATTHRRLSRTFDLAAAAQAAILPDERPIIRPEFELRGLCRPAAECGGDLWVWHELGGGKLLVLIADATGHGAAPALLSAVAKGAAAASWELGGQGELSPGDVLATIGRAVGRTGRRRYFMTAFCAILDLRTGELAYANAGQNFPYVISDGKLSPLVARGNWLGDDPKLSPVVQSRKLEVGDKLILYTDGAIDAGAPAASFGDKRFRAVLGELSGERAIRIPGALLERIERHLGNSELADDITLVALERSPGAGAA